MRTLFALLGPTADDQITNAIALLMAAALPALIALATLPR